MSDLDDADYAIRAPYIQRILALEAKVSEQERLLAECATNFDSVAEMVADWGVYAPIYFQEKWNLDGDVAEVREMADKARAATSHKPADTPDTAPQPPEV